MILIATTIPKNVQVVWNLSPQKSYAVRTLVKRASIDRWNKKPRSLTFVDYRQLGRQKCKEMEEELKSEQERNERIREIDAAARQQNDGSRNRRVVMAQAQNGHSDMEE